MLILRPALYESPHVRTQFGICLLSEIKMQSEADSIVRSEEDQQLFNMVRVSVFFRCIIRCVPGRGTGNNRHSFTHLFLTRSLKTNQSKLFPLFLFLSDLNYASYSRRKTDT